MKKTLSVYKRSKESICERWNRALTLQIDKANKEREGLLVVIFKIKEREIEIQRKREIMNLV